VLWLEWLGGLFKKIGRAPWVVVPPEDERAAPTLNLVIRDLLPEDYQLLTTDDRSYNYVENLTSPPTVESGAPLSSDTPTDSVLTWFKQHAV
jgi:hypothetical protein